MKESFWFVEINVFAPKKKKKGVIFARDRSHVEPRLLTRTWLVNHLCELAFLVEFELKYLLKLRSS
jgi:hypothetical protein